MGGIFYDFGRPRQIENTDRHTEKSILYAYNKRLITAALPWRKWLPTVVVLDEGSKMLIIAKK